MRKIHNILFFLIFLVFFSWQILPAQNAKESLFSDVEKSINEAREQGAEMLSPEFFSRAIQNFKEAKEADINNESTRDIREKLTEAQKYCNRAMEVVNLGKITLKEAIKAREDAIYVEANKYAKDLFNEAQEKFDDATAEVEDGDLQGARDKGSEAEALYRRSELKSIKDKLLGDARRLVEEAKEKDAEEFAPQTYFYASNLLSQVENLLRTDRYAVKEASTKVMECVYEAKHAMYLTQTIKGLMKDEKNWEKIILQNEDVLVGIAAQFDDKPKFDNGMKETVNMIISRISELKNTNQELIDENATLHEEYNLVKEMALASTAELEKKKKREEKIEKVKSLFSPSEAKMAFEGDNLIIRLHGLSFQPGKAVIQPEFFSLLTKVQEALKIFPDQHILLEGHTDSRGVVSINKRLSEERATAIREYIIANMGKKREQITAIGYGSNRPVASNKTSEGRAFNRRIDIVISLGE